MRENYICPIREGKRWRITKNKEIEDSCEERFSEVCKSQRLVWLVHVKHMGKE